MKTLTMLSSQQAVEHLLYYYWVEFDQLGERLDHFVLWNKNSQNQIN